MGLGLWDAVEQLSARADLEWEAEGELLMKTRPDISTIILTTSCPAHPFPFA